MKKLLLILLLFSVLFCTKVYAHTGRTDSNGGHIDHSTGEYHYHHGFPAHDHVDGICPYDYDDITEYDDFSNYDNNSDSNDHVDDFIAKYNTNDNTSKSNFFDMLVSNSITRFILACAITFGLPLFLNYFFKFIIYLLRKIYSNK